MQIIRKFSYLIAAIAEHHDLLSLWLGNEIKQQIVFFSCSDEIDDLIDRIRRHFLRLDLDHDGIDCPTLCEFYDGWSKCRTKQQSLSAFLLWGARNNGAHLRNKTHI